MWCRVGQEVLLTVFLQDSTHSHPCTVEGVDGETIELRVHSSGPADLNIPPEASGFLAGSGGQQPMGVLIADVSRLPIVRCVAERVHAQRRFYVRASGFFPLRYRLLKQQEYLRAREEYSCRGTYFGTDGLASADSWKASAMDVDNFGAEMSYLANSLAELHRKMDLVVNLLSSSGLPGGEDVRPRELRISGSGLDFTTEEELPVGGYLELEMWPPVVPSERIVALGKITRVEAASRVEGEQPEFHVAARFTDIGEHERSRIIQYVFSRQREELRVKRLGASMPENNG